MLARQTHLLRHVGRCYTVQTARVPFPGTPRDVRTPQAVEERIERSVLDGGVHVVTCEPGPSPAADSTISLYVRAGTRYESYQTLGAAHFLRHLAYKVPHDL